MHANANSLGFLAFVALVLAAAAGGVALLVGLVGRRWTLVLATLGTGLVVASGYVAALLGVALASRDLVLGVGVEQHICEIDCHVAYAVTGVRTARALGASGHGATEGVAADLSRPLLPAASYTTTLVFDLPADVRELRLLIADADPVKALVIGHENGPLHGKVLLALRER